MDIYKTRTVRGISFLFVAIDAMGDLTSLLSLGKPAQYLPLILAPYGVDSPQCLEDHSIFLVESFMVLNLFFGLGLCFVDYG